MTLYKDPCPHCFGGRTRTNDRESTIRFLENAKVGMEQAYSIFGDSTNGKIRVETVSAIISMLQRKWADE